MANLEVSDKEALRRELMRERFGDPKELEKERDNPVTILPVPKSKK